MANGNLRTTVPENRARFVQSDADTAVTHTTNNAESRTFYREWTEIDATVADTLAATMMLTAQISNPLADGQTYTGLYSNADVQVIENSRRWVTIRQKLIRLTTVTAATDLPQPVDAGRAEVLRPFQYDPGSADVRIFEYRYLDRSSQEVCLSSIADVDLALTGYTVIDRQWRTEPRGDRTCTFQTFQRKVEWTNVNDDGTDVDTIRIMGEDGYYAGVNYLKHLQSQSETAFGVPIDDAADILTGWHGDEDPSASGLATVNVAIQMRGDGEVYISRTREPVNTTATTSSGIVIERNMFNGGGTPKSCVVLIPNLLKATADSLLNTLRTATTITMDSTTYRNSSVKRRIHPSGLCDLIVTGNIATVGNVINRYQDGSISNFGQSIEVDDDGTRYRVIAQRLVVESEESAVKFMNAEDPYDGVELASLVRPVKNNLKQHLDGRMDYSPNLGRYICVRLVWQNVEPTVGTYAVAPPVED